MDKPQHSPTPWTADTTGMVIVASNGNVIAVTPGVPMLKPSAMDRANFQHIERCVNSYDLLWEAALKSADFFEHGSPQKYAKAQAACLQALQEIYGDAPKETQHG
jgi:hypothetical protein